MLRTSALVLLAVSPFLAYVLLLPPSEPESVVLEPKSVPTLDVSPTPLFSPSPVLADVVAEEPPPVSAGPATASVAKKKTPARPKTAIQRPPAPPVAAPQPAPAPEEPADEPPPSNPGPGDNDVGALPGGDPVACEDFDVPDCEG